MVTLTPEIKESLAASKLAFFATAAPDRTPNVVPIAAFKVLDDTSLLISDQFFTKTLANLRENPAAAISWWGEKGGFQIKGTVTIHTSGQIWEQDVSWMKEIRPNLKPKGAVVLKITGVYAVVPGAEPGRKIL
jgi:predicted pyridoxine 5'-phosphate oxidase superfamily flavin-nucleotide-binding protein